MESSVLDAARELFDARQFPGVAAVCAEALLEHPRDVRLRMLRARALLALRRDAAAQAEVGEVLRIEPSCAGAYRLLGELAARRDEPRSARAFLREALRLAPGDEETSVWLELVDAMVRPAGADGASAATEAAGAVAASSSSSSSSSSGRPRRPTAHVVPRAALAPVPPAEPEPDVPIVVEAPVLVSPPRRVMTAPEVAAALPPPVPPPRLRPARGTAPPPLPAHLRARASAPLPTPRPPAPPTPARRPVPPPFAARAEQGTPGPSPARAPIRRLPTVRAPELPGSAAPSLDPRVATPPSGFGAYLVDVGVLSELQLRASLAYKKSTGVRLGAAAVALGFATEARLESASLVYHGRHRRPSTIDVVASVRGAGRHETSSASFRI